MRYLNSRTMAVVIGLLMAAIPGQSAPQSDKPEPPIILQCKQDLAKRLKARVEEIKFIESQPVNWPDSALGLPEVGKVYAQVVTPGQRVIFENDGENYLYTTSSSAFRYGGPSSLKLASMLFIKPNPDDANLNGDLYQCSALGTNPVRMLSEVSDFYPQWNGIIVAKRRTSRSGHDLLYMNADHPGSAVTLYSAMDFGEVSVSVPGTEWAGFVRPQVGASWTLVVAPVDKKNAPSMSVPLPDGVQPGQIEWTGGYLTVLVRKGEKPLCYRISPGDENPHWEQVGVDEFPNQPPYVISKSQTLEVVQTKGAKPGVEVVVVWFNGKRDVLAKIDGVTMRGFGMVYSFLTIWGEKNGQPAVYTVDTVFEEVIRAAPGLPRDVKPFRFPPRESPLPPSS